MSVPVGALSGQARRVSEIIAATTGLPVTTPELSPAELESMLEVARKEARAGLAEGGIPIGAALFGPDGTLLGSGRNRRVQDGDPSLHGETSAFRAAGRRRTYGDTILVTTLSPCWYCSGLTRQFGIGTLIVGESASFVGQHEWLAKEAGVAVTLLDDAECRSMMSTFMTANPALWFEDIGETE
jgi:creatinine deaminase